MSRIVRWLLTAAVLLAACGALALITLFVVTNGNPVDTLQNLAFRVQLSSRQSELNTPVGSDETPVRFMVAAGDTPRIVAQNLAAAGLIRDAELFVTFVRANDLDTQIEAGTYFLAQSEPLTEIAYALTDSGANTIPFRILEGWRMEEVAAAIDDNPLFGFSGADFLRAVGPGATPDPAFTAATGMPPGTSLEGFLFPETYTLPASVTPEMLRDILLDEFMLQAGAPLAASAQAQGLSLYEAVTLASIIQREAVRVDEMPLISSVYRNRLEANMRLEADPTVQYGIGNRDGRWWPQITQADYSSAVSPYNTYLNTGLPPGPIASPGLAAIHAALAPQQSPYYFFRAACDGSGYHVFAITFDEHVANACP
ncbi:MAG: endolytic transglycosylase MltG [Anaerolineae bacterium]|nr:endolytic transglycosylase MltG [Anaerolineae bacterium]